MDLPGNCSCSGVPYPNVTMGECCCYQKYELSSIYMVGFGSMIMNSFGLATNILSVAVFACHHMRKQSINWYLIARSVTDFLLLLTSLLIFVLPRVGQYFEHWEAVNISHFTTPVTYALALIAQMASIYMTVLMTVHRFIGVCFPFKAHSILSDRAVRFAIIAVISWAFLFNLTKFFEVKLSNFCLAPNIGARIYELVPTGIRMDPTYQKVFYGWVATIFTFLIPFGVLIVMNSKVIQAIHQTRKRHAHLQGNSEDPTSKSELSKEINTSILLVAVVLLFLVCNALTLVVNVIEVSGSLSRGLVDYAIFTQMVDLSNFLVGVGCSCNIFIYWLFSFKFRVILSYYCCLGWTRNERMLLNSVVE